MRTIDFRWLKRLKTVRIVRLSNYMVFFSLHLFDKGTIFVTQLSKLLVIHTLNFLL